LADELRRAFGIEAELEEGDRGIFDVHADGKLVFSKHTEQRFPDPGEVVKRIEKRKS
jgi:selT/selW/selH-like putative selenoprotein